jgi:hypothetical protein
LIKFREFAHDSMYTDVQPRRRFTLSCQKFTSTLVTILLVNAFVACSGSPQRTIVQPTITASISPTTVALGPGGVQSFTTAVQNTTDTDVTWYVNQVNGGSSSTGTITSTGVYTAPSVTSQTVFTVTAVANANTSITASASVTVTPFISVTLNVHSASVKTGQTQQFSATVTNTTNTAVIWQVNGIVGGNSTLGTITPGGLYTAPSTVPVPNPVVTVTAVSVADPTKSDSASVTVTLTVVINVSVNPPAAPVVVATTYPFMAAVTGTPNQAVTWSVSGTGSECSGGGSPCGTIDSGGVYTAPSTVPTPATVTVTATSQADGTTTGTATVTVIASLGITISPSPSVGVAYSGQQQFNATVVGSSNPAVKWVLVCIADGEAPSPPNFPDCAGDAEGDGNPDAETNAIPVADQTPTSAIFFAATGPDQGSTYTLSLTATTVAVDGQGHTANATVTICVNATGMVNSGGTCP